MPKSVVMVRNIISKLLSNRKSTAHNSERSLFDEVDVQPGCVISSDSTIGEYTYVGMNTTITKASIGRYCSIANNVSIGDGEHLLDKVSTSSHFYNSPYDILTEKNCSIGNDVWIGTKSIIRRGVNIGDGAVIGANSFVNKDVPAYGIVVGSPSKLIRYRFDKDIIDLIIESKWWDLSIDLARNKISLLESMIKNKS